MSERLLPTSARWRVEIAEAVLQDYLALQATGRADLAEIKTVRSGLIRTVVGAVLFGAVLMAYHWLT